MAQNFIQDSGGILNVVAPGGGVVSGTAYVIGVAFGVALATAAAGVNFAYQTEGVVEYAKLATDVVTAGALLYFDAGNNRLTVTAGANKKVGYAVAAAGNGVATVRLRLVPTI